LTTNKLTKHKSEKEIIITKSFLFFIKFVNLYKILSVEKKEYAMSKQLL